ncbi:MAG: lipoate--protein ligase family protein, partial [Propionibacteriaceae bacterium]|nr:lipoate--protein ligase family protein [Propionibacteriaceae bacterium]
MTGDATGALHGEYKVPGGKLVRVELVVDGPVIASASVSGDFFLEPDDALDCLNQALVGVPVATNPGALSNRLAAALPADARLIGFDTAAVAVAVRRALGLAVAWDDLTFDVIAPVTLHPAWHVALDEVIAAEVAAGRRNPTLRFWDWDQGLVVIGSFQSVRN